MPIDITRRRAERELMVRDQIERRGISRHDLLEAFRKVPREAFVPTDQADAAYRDMPLAVGEGQVLNQAFMTAIMLNALDLRGDEKLLHIGTGCGYEAAVLSRLVDAVHTVDRPGPHLRQAERVFTELGYHNVCVHEGDPCLGWPDQAPYDAILVTTAHSSVPSNLHPQLSIGGQLLIPIRKRYEAQDLVRVTHDAEEHWLGEDLGDMRFLPLASKAMWNERGHGR